MTVNTVPRAVNTTVREALCLWDRVVLPTLIQRPICVADHHEYCRLFREFISKMCELRQTHERFPRAVAIQSALTPYHGINRALQPHRDQLPTLSLVCYRTIKMNSPPSELTGNPDPLDPGEFQELFGPRGTKRSRE